MRYCGDAGEREDVAVNGGRKIEGTRKDEPWL